MGTLPNAWVTSAQSKGFLIFGRELIVILRKIELSLSI
jgi:hypothetical protein